MSVFAFLKTQLKVIASQNCSSPVVNNLDHQNVSFAVICSHMYYSEWLVDILFAVPLSDLKCGLCTDQKVQTNPHACYVVNSHRMDLTNDIM
jgi:hypothetical protein